MHSEGFLSRSENLELRASMAIRLALASVVEIMQDTDIMFTFV